MSLGLSGRVIHLVVFILLSIIIIPVYISFYSSGEYIIPSVLLLFLLSFYLVNGNRSHYIKVENGKLFIWGPFRKYTFDSEDFYIIKPSFMKSESYKICFINGKTFTYSDKLKNGFYTSIGAEKIREREQYTYRLTELIKAELAKGCKEN